MTPDLNQLRDIHLPEPVSWWPLAPIWWILLSFLILIIIIAWFWYRRHKNNQWRRFAQAELTRLKKMPAQPAVRELSILLRRIAISHFSREEVARLNGEKWLVFLDGKTSGETDFQSGIGRLLIEAPFAPEAHISQEKMSQLFTLCENWIRHLTILSADRIVPSPPFLLSLSAYHAQAGRWARGTIRRCVSYTLKRLP
jgi:hypothetical protein